MLKLITSANEQINSFLVFFSGMLHICYPCEKFNPGQNFRFQRKGSLTKYQNLPECIRNQYLYNRLQSSSVSKRKSEFMETTTHKRLKHEFDIPPVAQMENESSLQQMSI